MEVDKPRQRTVILIALLSRMFVVLLGIIANYIGPSYDTAAEATFPFLVKPLHTFVSWDSFYFLKIASKGYQYEPEYAFFPGYPLLTRALAEYGLFYLKPVLDMDSVLVISGVLISNAFFVLAALYLYKYL